MEEPGLIDQLASLLEAGLPPLAAIGSLALARDELREAAARARVEGEISSSLRMAADAFGEDAPLVMTLVPGLRPDMAALVLRHAASASRVIRQLMEERDSAMRWHRRVSRILASSVAASTAVLGKVVGLLSTMLSYTSQGGWAPLSLVAVGLGFSALFLSEAGDDPAWMLLPLGSAISVLLLLEAIGV